MTTTAVDVRWQDGRQEARVPARDLVPVAHLDEHDFFVGDLVEEIDPLADMDAEAQVHKSQGLTSAPSARSWHVQGGQDVLFRRKAIASAPWSRLQVLKSRCGMACILPLLIRQMAFVSNHRPLPG